MCQFHYIVYGDCGIFADNNPVSLTIQLIYVFHIIIIALYMLDYGRIWIVFRKITFEPPHDKTNEMTCAPTKTQISQGIRPVWSESSLWAQWVAKDPSCLHADSEDSDQTGRMPRSIWIFTERTCHFVSFVMRWLILCNTWQILLIFSFGSIWCFSLVQAMFMHYFYIFQTWKWWNIVTICFHSFDKNKQRISISVPISSLQFSLGIAKLKKWSVCSGCSTWHTCDNLLMDTWEIWFSFPGGWGLH